MTDLRLRYLLTAVAALGLTLSSVTAAPRKSQNDATPAAVPTPASPATPSDRSSAGNAVSPEPQRTSASYGDWVVRCDRNAGKKACEAVQTFTIKGREAPFAQIAFVNAASKGDAGGSVSMVLLLPVNLSFEHAPSLTIAGNEANALSFKLLRCLPEGCIASFTVANDALTSLRGGANGQATFFDAAGQKVNLPLSVKGLSPALDALVKESVSN